MKFLELMSILIILIFSMTANANDNCTVSFQQSIIDYGALTRTQLNRNSQGLTLDPKTVVIQINCLDNVDPELAIKDIQKGGDTFAYGKNGKLNILLKSFQIDGQIVSTEIIRNNVIIADTEKLRPNDVIQPKNISKGKNITAILQVEPIVSDLDLLEPNSIINSEAIEVLFNNLSSNTFTIISKFAAIACQPSISNNGTVNYGEISKDTLNKTNVSVLPAQALKLNISCDGPINFALRADSNRPDSLVNIRSGTTTASGAAKTTTEVRNQGLGQNLPLGLDNISDPDVAGLGRANNKNIGGYLMVMPVSNILLDGIPAQRRYSTTGLPSLSSSWTKGNIDDITGGSLFSGSYYFAYSKSDGINPESFTNLEADIIIQAYITEAINLDFSYPIILDGSATIEFYYY